LAAFRALISLTFRPGAATPLVPFQLVECQHRHLAWLSSPGLVMWSFWTQLGTASIAGLVSTPTARLLSIAESLGFWFAFLHCKLSLLFPRLVDWCRFSTLGAQETHSIDSIARCLGVFVSDAKKCKPHFGLSGGSVTAFPVVIHAIPNVGFASLLTQSPHLILRRCPVSSHLAQAFSCLCWSFASHGCLVSSLMAVLVDLTHPFQLFGHFTAIAIDSASSPWVVTCLQSLALWWRCHVIQP